MGLSYTLISAALVSSGLFYLVIRILYNLFFHPLANYPGPILWRAFRFPFIKTMISGELPHRVKSIHEKYGEVVRVGPDELSFTNPAAWRDIHTKNFARPREYKNKPPGKDAENLVSASEKDHARFRKILAPAFSERSTQKQQPLVQSSIDLLIRKLHQAITDDKSGSAAVVDVLKWFNYTTFDIIWSSSFGCLEEVRYHPWIQVISQFKTALIALSFKFYPPLDDIIKFITPKSALADLRQVWKTTEEKVARRLAMKNNLPDVISHILDINESSSALYMSREEIEINAMTLVVGGSESVTTVLVGITNYLLREQSKLQALVDEVRSTFQDEDAITGNSVSSLPYLNAVLQEGLRMCPTIADGMRRQVSTGGATVAGHFLPQGTVVSIPQWATYQSPSNFHSPTSFVPERWLPRPSDSFPSFSRDRKDAFNPFSLGPHNCPGQNLAYLEMRLILTGMVWNFDMEIPRGTELPQWGKQKIYWFWDKESTCVSISRAR